MDASYFDLDGSLPDPKRGITRSFLRQADLRLQIPYARETYPQSLGTAAATAVISFEIMRQRKRA